MMARPLLRTFDPERDTPLVVDSWTRQIRRCCPFRDMPPALFEAYRAVLLALILRTPPQMACSPTDDLVTYGYACSEVLGGGLPGAHILHMVYIRSGYRQRGYATVLLRAAFPELGAVPLFQTYPTRAARHFRDRWCLQFNPYLAQVLS